MRTLILFAHVGAMCNGNSNALDHVHGFVNRQDCVEVGKAVAKLADGTCKEIKFVCVVVPK